MLPSPRRQIRRHPRVKHAIWSVGHDVNGGGFHRGIVTAFLYFIRAIPLAAPPPSAVILERHCPSIRSVVTGNRFGNLFRPPPCQPEGDSRIGISYIVLKHEGNMPFENDGLRGARLPPPLVTVTVTVTDVTVTVTAITAPLLRRHSRTIYFVHAKAWLRNNRIRESHATGTYQNDGLRGAATNPLVSA